MLLEHLQTSWAYLAPGFLKGIPGASLDNHGSKK